MTETHFIWSTQQEKLFITILTVTLLLLFSHLSSAVEFDFTHPKSVQIDDPFEVTINLNAQETFDVKIFVHKSDSDRAVSADYISEIEDDGWKSSWNYLKEAFPKNKNFQVKVISDSGERNICVRLRKSGTSTTSLKCEPITVKDGEQKTESTYFNKTILKGTSNSKPDSAIQQEETSFVSPSSPNEKIYLQSPKKTSSDSITTKKEQTRSLTVYLIVLILAALAILIAFRRL